jgi:hypothetical protein
MAGKFICDWDHRDEAKFLVKEGRRWYFSCEKHLGSFSADYIVPIEKSVLMRDAIRAAAQLIADLKSGKVLRIRKNDPNYSDWEFYVAVIENSGEPKVCDIGYSPKFAKFMSPLYLTLERYESAIARLLINGWQIEILDGSVSNISDEADLRRFVKEFYQKGGDGQ